MSIERVIASFILVGLALCLSLLLMPVTGSILVFLVTIVLGGFFLVKGLRNLRTQPSRTEELARSMHRPNPLSAPPEDETPSNAPPQPRPPLRDASRSGSSDHRGL